jgi:hypothetical protein
MLREALSENLDPRALDLSDWERGELQRYQWAHYEMEYVIVDGPEPVSAHGVAGMAAGWREGAASSIEGSH